MTTNIWFTSDHHFHHKNIIRSCNRPFDSVEEMNEIMICKWNEVILPRDRVYYLGDMMWEYDQKLLSRLNGEIKIIPGNHDFKLGGYAYSTKTGTMTEEQLIIKFNWNHNQFILCHYPILEWDGFYRGSYHLHGHCHGTSPKRKRVLDVGVDTHDFYPYNYDEVLELLTND